MKLEEEYKDINIEYDEDKNKWCINKWDMKEREEYDSLKSAKASIDRKLKIKYIEQSVWVIGGADRWASSNGFRLIKQCTATRPHDKNNVWVTDGKNRSAKSKKDVFLNTDNNRKLFMEIAEQEKIVDNARTLAYELSSKLERIGDMKPVE